MESIMSWVISALSGHVSREMIVFIISMVPILELRGGENDHFPGYMAAQRGDHP